MQYFLKKRKTTESFECLAMAEFKGLFPLMSLELKRTLIRLFKEKVKVLSKHGLKDVIRH